MATGALNQRAVVQPQINKARTQVIASPVDTMVSPTTGNLSRLAQALSGLGQVAQPLIDLSEKKVQEEYLKAKQEKERQDKEAANAAASRAGAKDALEGNQAAQPDNQHYWAAYMGGSTSQASLAISQAYAQDYAAHGSEPGWNAKQRFEQIYKEHTHGVTDPRLLLSIRQSVGNEVLSYEAKFRTHQEEIRKTEVIQVGRSNVAQAYDLVTKNGGSLDAVVAYGNDADRNLRGIGVSASQSRTEVSTNMIGLAVQNADLHLLDRIRTMRDSSGYAYSNDPAIMEKVAAAQKEILDANLKQSKAQAAARSGELVRQIAVVTQALDEDPTNPQALKQARELKSELQVNQDSMPPDTWASKYTDVAKTIKKSEDYIELQSAVEHNTVALSVSNDPQIQNAATAKLDKRISDFEKTLNDPSATAEQHQQASAGLMGIAKEYVSNNISLAGTQFLAKATTAVLTNPDSKVAPAYAGVIQALIGSSSAVTLMGINSDKELQSWRAWAVGIAKGPQVAAAAFNAEKIKSMEPAPKALEKAKWSEFAPAVNGVASHIPASALKWLDEQRDAAVKADPNHDVTRANVETFKKFTNMSVRDAKTGKYSPAFTFGSSNESIIARNQSAGAALTRRVISSGHNVGLSIEQLKDATYSFQYPEGNGDVVMMVTTAEGQQVPILTNAQELSNSYLGTVLADVGESSDVNAQLAQAAKDEGASPNKPIMLVDSPRAEAIFMKAIEPIMMNKDMGLAEKMKKLSQLTDKFNAHGFKNAAYGMQTLNAYLYTVFPNFMNHSLNLLGERKAPSSPSNNEDVADMYSKANTYGSRQDGTVDTTGAVAPPTDEQKTGVYKVGTQGDTPAQDAKDALAHLNNPAVSRFLPIAAQEGYAKFPYKDGKGYSIGFGFSTTQGDNTLMKAAAFAGIKDPQKWVDGLKAGSKAAAITPEQGARLFEYRLKQDSEALAKKMGGEENLAAWRNKNPQHFLALMSMQYTNPAIASAMAGHMQKNDLAGAVEAAKKVVDSKEYKQSYKDGLANRMSRKYLISNNAELNRFLIDFGHRIRGNTPRVEVASNI